MRAFRLVFMGTPAYAVPTLQALIASRHRVVAAYSQPPRARGRGQKPTPSPVADCADSYGISVRTPRTLKDPDAQAAFQELAPDLAITIAYGLILPAEILAIPRLGCLNAHASLLPRWRGAAPLQRAILAGDTETGVTIMQMDEGLDTGPMLRQARVPIAPETTTGELHDTLAALSARLVTETIEDYATDRARLIAQSEAGASYAAKVVKGETEIDWRLPAARIERAVRAFAPAPGAWFTLGDERIKVLAAKPLPLEQEVAPGTVVDRGRNIAIACAGASALEPTRVQRGGKAPMTLDAFLRGRPIPAGTRLPCPATS